MNSVRSCLLLGLVFLPPVLAAGKPLAFPGAEGFGQFASGGRGGEIFHVTTLDDSGPGSFRDAVSRPGRVVVFDVGGLIRLKSNVAVNSRITLAGQTAPGDGVVLYGRSVSFSGRSNVIVRYLRFREGIQGDRGKCSVNLSAGSDMIFDHCSIEWGRWDCLGVTQGSHDITFQHCIIGEGVDPQRFGSLSDAVDLRLIEAVKSFGTRGRINHSEAEAGGPGVWKEVHAPANLKIIDAEKF